jgi:hypothetical protein
MRRKLLSHLLRQTLKIDLLICFIAYLLQQFCEQLFWVFIISLIILVWLIVAGVTLLLDFLVEIED